MTDKKPPQNPVFVAALAALTTRHQLSETQTAGLLGVPVFTLRKWRTGARAPSAAAVRLVEVLDMVGALAPALLGGLTPAPVPPKPPKRKAKTEKSPL
jgi:DNA-binding transcriptional regulator YiaG